MLMYELRKLMLQDGANALQAHGAIIFGKPSIYSTPEWMTIPFIGMPRDAHQRLADIELMIPTCIQRLQIEGSLRVCFETRLPPNFDVEPCRQLASKLLANLTKWAARYPNLTTISKDADDIVDVAKRSGSGLDIANEHSRTPPLPDTFIALIASNYVATKLTLNMLLNKINTEASTPPATPTSTTTDYFDEASQCATAILRGAANVERVQTPGFDMMRCIPPLVTVACVGPREEHFRDAKEMLQRWGARIGGLSSIIDKLILSPRSAGPND